MRRQEDVAALRARRRAADMKHSLLVGLALRAAARVHFLHVPKSGGTFLHHVIRQAVDAQEGCDIHANTHVKLARDVKRVIQRRFNLSVPRARVSKTAPMLRERSER